MRISYPQAKVMRNLAQMKYLTIKQFARLGNVRSHIKNIPKVLPPAEHYGGLVDYYAVPSGIGGKQHVYFLTKKGAEFLAEEQRTEPQAFEYVKKKTGLSPFTAPHLFLTVDFHIALLKFLGKEKNDLQFFHSYYMYEHGKKAEAKTNVVLSKGRIVPDALFCLRAPKRPYFFALEVCRSADSKRIESQAASYITGMKEGAFRGKYRTEYEPRVLLLFEDKQQMLSMMQRMKNTPAFAGAWQKAFYFGIPERPHFHMWQDFEGNNVSMFD
jgi:hypothetical protein